jgi:hypothetical protein
MSAKRESNASHTWNAILFRSEALKKGLIILFVYGMILGFPVILHETPSERPEI